MFRRSLTREPTWISIGLGLSPFSRPGRRVCWCIAIFGRLPSQRQRSEMTNYTIVGSRSTGMPIDASRFYSPFVSSAQRLPHGITLITEGSDGRMFEVTRNHELVWEYISPYWGKRGLNMVYRAYRAPYAWVPYREAPVEVPVP